MFGISSGQIFLCFHIAAVTVCAIRVLYRQRNTGTAFAWLMVLFVFPLFGVAAYLLVGEARLGMARAKRVEQMNAFYRQFAERHFQNEDLDTDNKMRRRYQGIANVAASVTGLAASNNNAMQLLTQTDEILEAMLADIQSARQTCALAFYIIEPQGRIQTLLAAVRDAAQRGVDVVLILPEKVDSFLVRWASRAYYPKLLAAGVKIALFHGGLLHAKTLVVDGDYALFGTVNMDMRSFFLNLEISLVIYDAPVVREISRAQKAYLRDSRYISVKRWQKRERIWGLVENTVRLFSPLL